MIPLDFIDSYPCDSCDELRRVDDAPPYVRCRLSMTGDQDCDRMETVGRVSERIGQVAAIIAREPDRRLRAEEARQIADAYSNVLYELGASLDDTQLLHACQVARSCVRCEGRAAGDGYTRKCADCALVVVAA